MHIVNKVFKTDKAFVSGMYLVYLAAIHFHPLSSARLPMNIRLTSPLHTTHVRSFTFCFRKFSPILSIFGADENGWSHLRNFARPLCPLCIRFVSIGQWDRAFICNVMCSFHMLQSFVWTDVILFGLVSFWLASHVFLQSSSMFLLG